MIVLGIDPAPSKETWVWRAEAAPERIPALEVRPWVEEFLQENPDTLISWDAPLTFDPARSLSDRAVDKGVRRWVREQVAEGRFAPHAISALPFSSCPHWAISSIVLGLPYGTPPQDLRLAPLSPKECTKGPYVFEAHPAVSMGVWWIERDISDPFPKYKGSRGGGAPACQFIAERLDFPSGVSWNNDLLDAYAAFQTGELFLHGDAEWVGTPHAGGYVLPLTAQTQELQERIRVLEHSFGPESRTSAREERP